ncbi:MAG TPA: TRAP transporter large permease [Candidatus Methylomirabilis sp.]|nr:TRAP transporter large permease [Candidatus Methylomirabilis sp.]
MGWVILGSVLFLAILNVPIGFTLAIATIVVVMIQGTAPLEAIPLMIFGGASKFPLLAIPLFILAGGLMTTSGISTRLINLASALVGFIRGGLAMVTIVASMFFGEISGSAVAGAAAIGQVVIPAMEKKGYPKAFSAGVVSNAATLAIIIPPSIPMIIYAAMADTSVVKMFISGIVPGVIGGGLMMLLSYYFARTRSYPAEATFSLRQVGLALQQGFWALMIPVVIWGGIFGGIATATEVGGVAALSAILIGVLIYRELGWRDFWKTVVESSLQTAVIMLIVATSAVLGWYLTNEGVPQQIAGGMLGLTQNKYLILLLLNVAFLIAGCFLHSAAAIILIVPIVLPLIKQLGIDPIHFGLIVTINLGIGQQTPPVATVLITTSAIAGLSMWEVFKTGFYYMMVLVLLTLLVTYVPQTGLWLVNLVYGG